MTSLATRPRQFDSVHDQSHAVITRGRHVRPLIASAAYDPNREE